jgi:DNA-binding GntR family transcriptional regulator
MSLDDDRPLPDRLYDEVRARIVSGVLAPGRPLRQDTIATELGVSKIPLREALNRLEQDGLVALNPRRGYEVAPMTAGGAEDVFDLRMRIEPAAAALGAQLATDDDRLAARGAFAALDTAIANGDPRASDLNREFHLALVRPGRRPLTTQLVDRLHALSARYVGAHLQPEGRSERARHEHRELFDAWIAQRPHSVETLVRAHIAVTLDDLRDQLKV